MNMERAKYWETQQAAVRLLNQRCPRLSRQCYWAGTSAIAIEELHHRLSFDLDFHTLRALSDVRPILAELQNAFPDAFEIVQAPDEFGSGFGGVWTLPDGVRITVEARSNFEDVREDDLVVSTTCPDIRRVSLARYLADKMQCVAERVEARDLADVFAVLRSRPDMETLARRLLEEQDALLIAERLLLWTNERIEADLAAYEDVSPQDACRARDRLLHWLRAAASEDRQP